MFATELLMPETPFKNKVNKKKLNVGLLDDVSGYFGTSRLATVLRYASLGDFPVMIIFMENGIIKWKQLSHDFPFTYLPINSKVPAWTVAGDFFYKDQLETKPEKVDAIEWFPEDYRIKSDPDCKLWEQCYPVAGNCLVSCIWTL